MSETIDNKPRKVRGTATFYNEDEFEFKPYGHGEPVKQNMRKVGSSQIYETTGAKTSKMVAHLSIPKDSSDPAADLQKQLDMLVKPLRKKEPTLPRGKSLVDTDELKVWFKKDKKQIVATLYLDTTQRPAAQMFKLMSEINKIIEQTSLK